MFAKQRQCRIWHLVTAYKRTQYRCFYALCNGLSYSELEVCEELPPNANVCKKCIARLAKLKNAVEGCE